MWNPKLSKPAQSYEVSFEASVRAPRERVWQALTAEVGRWWPGDFYTTENPTGFVIEPELGGRVYEGWVGGGGVLWGTVAVWLPGYRMTWSCDMPPDTGGPGQSFVTFELEEKGLETVIRVQDAGVCVNPSQAATGLAAGWERLVRVHFKEYVEADVRRGPSVLDSDSLGVRAGGE